MNDTEYYEEIWIDGYCFWLEEKNKLPLRFGKEIGGEYKEIDVEITEPLRQVLLKKGYEIKKDFIYKLDEKPTEVIEMERIENMQKEAEEDQKNREGFFKLEAEKVAESCGKIFEILNIDANILAIGETGAGGILAAIGIFLNIAKIAIEKMEPTEQKQKAKKVYDATETEFKELDKNYKYNYFTYYNNIINKDEIEAAENEKKYLWSSLQLRPNLYLTGTQYAEYKTFLGNNNLMPMSYNFLRKNENEAIYEKNGVQIKESLRPYYMQIKSDKNNNEEQAAKVLMELAQERCLQVVETAKDTKYSTAIKTAIREQNLLNIEEKSATNIRRNRGMKL